MGFSKRTEWDTEESELARAHRERVAAGLPLADLTASNPTRCGFRYPADTLAHLTDPEGLDYDPNPKGSLSARRGVCEYYRDHGVELDAERILLTTGTSEAYGYLFKLLLNPGEGILAPRPGYPLFDFLADSEVVTVGVAPLVYDHGWQLDLEGLRAELGQRTGGQTRAVVLVHPNNPTGHFTKAAEAGELAAVCREHGLALIVDEVFLDYGLGYGADFEVGGGAGGEPAGIAGDRGSFGGRNLGVLTFLVSGLSKIAGLPQMKVAWLAALGPGAGEAMARLEVLADTYLSVNTPMQRALPRWLRDRGLVQGQIRERVLTNLGELDRALAKGDRGLVTRLEVEGGWYAVLRIPARRSDEETVRRLLDLGVWVQPGYYFGLGKSGWVVVSLIARVEEFSTGLRILLQEIARESGE